MFEVSLPLTALSEAQKAQTMESLTIIRPTSDKEATQAQVACTYQPPLDRVQLWVKRYQEKGLVGQANATSFDKGISRHLSPQAIQSLSELAFQIPPCWVASTHCQVSTIAKEQSEKPPSDERVHHIIKRPDPAPVTIAHQGATMHHEGLDVLSRREAIHFAVMWHLDAEGLPAQPRFTVMEDHSRRTTANFRRIFQKPTAPTTALALRQMIWHKEHLYWHVRGLSTAFSIDHGFHLIRKQMKQVWASIKQEGLIGNDPGDLAEIPVLHLDRFSLTGQANYASRHS